MTQDPADTQPDDDQDSTDIDLAVAFEYGWALEAGAQPSFSPAGCCCHVSVAGGALLLEGYDTNGDGVVDAAAIDLDGDGLVDAYYVDENGDGVWDTIRDTRGNVIGIPMSRAEAQPAESKAPSPAPRGQQTPAPARSGSGGVPELTLVQADGTRITVTAVDADGDGIPESASFDQDGDGKADLHLVDADGDGIVDTIYVDLDGDGKPDTLRDPSESGKWTAEGSEPAADTATAVSPDAAGHIPDPAPTGDAHRDIVARLLHQSAESAASIWKQLFPNQALPGTDAGTILNETLKKLPEGSEEAATVRARLDDYEQLVDHLITEGGEGYPAWYSDLVWSQTQSVNGFCVPVSVGMVISEFFGNPADVHGEMELVGVAIDKGWLTMQPDGTWTGMTAPQAELMLEHYNIPAHVENGSIEDLKRYVEEGRGVILAVDSSEVWSKADDDGTAEDKGPDHALVIKSIDDTSVVLFDPGDPGSPVREMSLEDFKDAWADGENLMIVTDVAPPAAQAETAAPADPATRSEPATAVGAASDRVAPKPSGGLSPTSYGMIARGVGLVLLPVLLRKKLLKRDPGPR